MMQSSQNKTINYPDSNELLSLIQNSSNVNEILQDLHQPILDLIHKDFSRDFFSDPKLFEFLTKVVPSVFLTLIKNDADQEQLKSLYSDLILLTIRSNFDFNLIDLLSYPFENLEIPTKPVKLFDMKKKVFSTNIKIDVQEAPKTEINPNDNENSSQLSNLDSSISSPHIDNLQHSPKLVKSNSSHISHSKFSKAQGKSEKPVNQTLLLFLNSLNNSEFFPKAANLISAHSFNLSQLSSLLNLFIYTEPYLPDEKIVYQVTFFEQVVNHFLQRIQKIENVNELHFFDFISLFHSMLYKTNFDFVYFAISRLILETTTSQSNNNALLEIQTTLLNTIWKLIRKIGFGNSIDYIKKSLFALLSNRKNDSSIISTICSIFTSAFEKGLLTADDISALYINSSQTISDSIINMLSSNKKENPTSIVHTVLITDSYFSLHLALYLIGAIDSQSLAFSLFLRLLREINATTEFPRKKIFYQFANSFPQFVNNIIEFLHYNTDDNPECAQKIEDSKFYLPKLALFLTKVNNDDFSVTSFITKLISIHENVPEVETVLTDYLGPKNPTFPIEKYYQLLFEQIIDLVMKGTYNRIQSERLANILVKWTHSLKASIPESLINKLITIDFKTISSEIPKIISKIVQKSSTNKKLLKNLAIQIVTTTVKPKYACWAMKTITNILGGIITLNDRSSDIFKNSLYLASLNPDDLASNGMSTICDILLKNLRDESKYRNSMYMIMWQAMIECDFYNIQERSFFSQKIAFEYESKKNEIVLSFHPYHSMRRLYVAVSEHTGLPISQFTLSTVDDDKELKIRDPLTNFHFDINMNTTIYLIVKHEPASTNELEFIIPRFLSCLEQQDNASILCETINQLTEESEIAFKILHLVDSSFHKSEKKFFIGDCQDFFSSLELIEFYSIIPLALSQLSEKPSEWKQDLNEIILDCLCDYPYSTVDLSIACRSILKLFTTKIFSKRIVKKCLLDTKTKILRKTFATLIASTDVELLSFLDLTIKSEYRPKTKEYFELIRNRIDTFDNEILVPFYLEMKQFELSYFYDSDDSFIGLLSCLKPNLDCFNITIDRLFECPTVKNPQKPFCQTFESRKAAFEYLIKCYSLPAFKDSKINSLFDLLKLSTDMSPIVLSDDLSFVGRNLITNGSSLGAIISLLANVEPFLSWLFYIDKSKMAPHVVALREFIATLIYSREGAVDISDLLISREFNNVLHVKPEIVLLQLFSVIDNCVESSFGMSSLFGFEIDSRPFNYLKVQVKGYKTIEQSIRENLKISNFLDDGCENPQRMITKWPEYFLIHLDRYDNDKFVVDQFEFPLFLNSKYAMIGAVLQCNDNRFITLTTNYNDWFVTSKEKIEYFNEADIPAWCYGSNDEMMIGNDEFTCAVILLYRRYDGHVPKFTNQLASLEPTIEEKINAMNQNIWPGIVFTSQLFVNFAFKSNNFELAFNVICRICFRDLDFLKSILPKCKDLIMKTHSSQRLFKEFVFNNFGISTITKISLEASEILASLITPPLKEKDDFSKLIQYFTEHETLNDYFLFINILKINHEMCEMNSDFMQFSLQFLTTGRKQYEHMLNLKNRDSFNQKQREVFDSLINAVSRNLKYKEFTEVVKYVFDPVFLESWKKVITVSDKYKNLVEMVSKHNSHLFSNLASLPPILDDLFSRYQPKEEKKPSLKKIMGFVDNYWDSLIIPSLFANEKNLRDSILNYLITLLPEPEKSMKRYIERRMIDETIEKPKIIECAYGFKFTGELLKAMNKIHSNYDICDAYLELLESRICYISPNAVRGHLNDFFTFLKQTKDEDNDPAAEWLFMIIHHILAFDPTALNSLNPTQISELLSTRIGTVYAIQILYILKNNQTFEKLTNGSILSGTSFDACFESYYDEHSSILTKLIKNGLIVDNISVDIQNSRLKDLMTLELLNEMYENQKDLRFQLYCCMKKTIEPMKKVLLFGSNSVLKKTLEILDNFNEDDYKVKSKHGKSKRATSNFDEIDDTYQLSSTEEETYILDYEKRNTIDSNVFIISNTKIDNKKEKKKEKGKIDKTKKTIPKEIETPAKNVKKEIVQLETKLEINESDSEENFRRYSLLKMFEKISQNTSTQFSDADIEDLLALPEDAQLYDLTDKQQQFLETLVHLVKGRPPNAIANLLNQQREFMRTGKMPTPKRPKKKKEKQIIEKTKKEETEKKKVEIKPKKEKKVPPKIKKETKNEESKKLKSNGKSKDSKPKKEMKKEPVKEISDDSEVIEEEEEEVIEYEYEEEEEEEEVSETEEEL